MVTVAPLASVANTSPPGFSRMKAPPPSAARITARIGVGSAVTVEVAVAVGARVAKVSVGFGVREGFLTGTPITAVARAISGDEVMTGITARVGVNSITATGSGDRKS